LRPWRCIADEGGPRGILEVVEVVEVFMKTKCAFRLIVHVSVDSHAWVFS
jgi:hypothetical protein